MFVITNRDWSSSVFEADLLTAENTARVTITMLGAWSIDIHILYTAVCETTAVNSGVKHVASACTEIEEETALL